MSGSGDNDTEMPRHHPLDDVAIEAFFNGHEAGEGLALLDGFVKDLHIMASGPAPVPSRRLAAVLADGLSAYDDALLAPAPSNPTGPATVRGSSWTRKRKLMIAQLAGLSVAAKAVLGISAAAAAVTAGGAVGVLPGPAQHAVSTGLEAVTPFSFPDRAESKADFGGRVSTDASDGGVDGVTVSGEAKLNGQPIPPVDVNAPADAGRPAAPGQKGLDQAKTTPAAGHVPRSVPAGPPATAGTPAAGSTPAADRLPTSIPTGPPASTRPAGAGTQDQRGPGAVGSTPAAEPLRPGTARPVGAPAPAAPTTRLDRP